LWLFILFLFVIINVMENKLILDKLYILSGPSGSGKTTFIEELIKQGLPEDSVIQIDKLSQSIFGTQKINKYYMDLQRNSFKSIAKEMLSIRLSQNMATFIDDANLTEQDRKEYQEIAHKHGMNSEVLIFDTDEATLQARTELPKFALKEQLKNFENKSSLPYRLINESLKYEAKPSLLNTTKLDIVGDVHGLFDELIKLLEKSGWKYLEKDNSLTHEDPERRLLFVGDIVDRGTQSMQVLKLVKNLCDKGLATLILGNHEEKLLSSYKKYKETGIFAHKSLSASLTFTDFLKLKEDEQESLFNFLKFCSVRQSVWLDKTTGKITDKENANTFKIGVCHAPNEYYDESFMPRSLALYGAGMRDIGDMDKTYNDNYKNGSNTHILFRGHVANTSKQEHVFSLEGGQAFDGSLVILKLDRYIGYMKKNNWESKYEYFIKSTIKYKTNFNYNSYVKERVMLLNEMNNLVIQGLATDGWRRDPVSGHKMAHEDGFKVYKYSKQVHFKRLWKSNPWLEKARGLVLDAAGNIIVHPFDKLYNFGEYDVGQELPKDKKVQVIEKVNGYLGCISKHPFKDELVLSTTGSIAKDAPFVQMIADYITPELNTTLLEYFKKNNKTLMFEVVHPKDPHIIEYNEKDYGLWLIGAREKQLSAKVETEGYLDLIGQQLGFKRPKWEEKTFGEVLESLQSSELEGFMIRDAEDKDNTPLMKIKTNYYLVTKFVGRMGGKMVKMMFNHSEQFKEEKVDEEFYPIVDKIISKVSESNFNEMPQLNRVNFVREIVNETRQEFLDNAKKIKLNM
jgi:predicted kinase